MGFKRPRVRISTLGPKKQKQLLLFLLFSLCRDSNTSCNTPGECCSRRLVGAKQLFSIPNGIENVSESRHSASQPGNIYSVKQAQKIQNNFCCSGFFIFNGEIRKINATRMSVADDGLRSVNHNFSHRQNADESCQSDE